MATTIEVPVEVLRAFNHWIGFFQELWWGEVPLKMHERGLDESGSPQWHPEFSRWLFAEPAQRYDVVAHETADQRLRTTRAFRRLRRKAPREFDVLYLMVARKPPMGLREVSEALTARAIRNDKPERYNEEAVLMLAISGLDKTMRWW